MRPSFLLQQRRRAYFSALTKAASAVACSGVTELIGLMCGALGSPPLVRIASVLVEPAILGATGGLPCPSVPWQAAHLVLNSVAPSCAGAWNQASMEMDATTAVAMRSFMVSSFLKCVEAAFSAL